MSKIDLHIHSGASTDGEFSPQEIVAQCKAQGMELIAITDHKTVEGVRQAQAVADGLQMVTGVELDCTYGGKGFHLLGYGIDCARKEFDEIEQDILQQEKQAAEEKIWLFRQATDIPISVVEVVAASGNGIVTGELIAEFVLAQPDAAERAILHPYLPGGAKSDMPYVRFYWDFFAEGKVAYVPIRYFSLPDAVALIHSAGGIAVLAHPGQNLGGDDTLLKGIISQGIEGIEVFSSYHSSETAAHYLGIAEQNQLLVTCGSDFHGKNKPNITLGGHGALWDDQRLAAGIAKFTQTVSREV